MANGRPAPVPLEALPLPGAPPEVAQPQPAQKPQRQIPPGAGYTGTTGKVANIASSFIEKFIEGKERGETQRRKKISDELGYLKYNVETAYKRLDQDEEYKKWRESPEEFKEEIAERENHIRMAHQAYTGAMSQYVKTNKSKKGGFWETPLGKVFGIFTPSGDPNLFPEGMVQQMIEQGPLLPELRSPRERADWMALEAAQEKFEAEKIWRAGLGKTDTMTPPDFERFNAAEQIVFWTDYR